MGKQMNHRGTKVSRCNRAKRKETGAWAKPVKAEK